MTDTLTCEEAPSETFPDVGLIATSKWHGSLAVAGRLAFATIHESDEHPGYFHCEVAYGADVVETKRPIRAEGVRSMLDHMLRARGFSCSDLRWQSVEAWSQVRAPKAGPTKSVVYFLAAGPFIKIGKGSNDAVKRANDLQTGCPYPITIMATTPGGVREEKALHRRFAHLRAHGEWFHSDPEILSHISIIAGDA